MEGMKMGCRNDYMSATPLEEQSRALMHLLREVGLINYEPGYYGEVSKIDEHCSMLCEFCQRNDVKNYSLELQIWWRDHQDADKRRIEKEFKSLQEKVDKEAALSKLTDYERKLLGV